jgi:hypothetical protein
MRTQSFEPEVVDLGQQYYDPETLAEPVSEGAIVQLNTVPFEEVDQSPGLQAYLEAYEAVGSSVSSPPRSACRRSPPGSCSPPPCASWATTSPARGARGAPDHHRHGMAAASTSRRTRARTWAPPASCTCRGARRAFVRLWPEEPTTWQCDEAYRFDLGDDFGGGATLGG